MMEQSIDATLGTTRMPSDREITDRGLSEEDVRHRELIALGMVCGDLSPRTIARHANVPYSYAVEALEWGAAHGVLVDGAVPERAATELMGELGRAWLADAHARVARQLLTHGWECVDGVARHARAAGALGPIPDLVTLLDHAGTAAVSTSDYRAARVLLETADDVSTTDDAGRRARRLCALAEALDGLGHVERARHLAARAFDLAEIAGDAALAARAAVFGAFPSIWLTGDVRTSAILRRAEDMDQSAGARVALLGARAIAEMRVPLAVTGRHQVAWVTRASVAQPLAAEALARSTGGGPMERLVALLAWRTCHRSPRHLGQRLETSHEAFDISQRLRLPARQVEAAIMLGADAIESGDRATFDHALSVARWVAASDGNPRLLAHTRAMEAGAAFADGDLESAQRLRVEAVEFADAVDLPSRSSLSFVLQAEHHAVSGEHPPRDLILRDDHPMLAHPLALAATALTVARLGERDEAETLVRRGLRQLDEESSMLLTLVLAAEAAVLIGSADLCDRLISLLAPWSEHVAIDGIALWHAGPVAAALAELAAVCGDPDVVRHVADAERIASAIGDTRALRRMERVRASLTTPHVAQSGDVAALSTRQARILGLVAAGLTNREIAAHLSYSVSTVKAEISTVLRTLGLENRTEAVRYAMRHRLVTDLESVKRG